MSTKAKGRKMSINLDRAPVQDHSSSPMSSPRRRRASQVELDLARVLVMCSDVRKRSQNSDGSYAEEGSCVERARNLRHQAENCVQRLRALMGLGSSVKAIQAVNKLKKKAGIGETQEERSTSSTSDYVCEIGAKSPSVSSKLSKLSSARRGSAAEEQQARDMSLSMPEVAGLGINDSVRVQWGASSHDAAITAIDPSRGRKPFLVQFEYSLGKFTTWVSAMNLLQMKQESSFSLADVGKRQSCVQSTSLLL